MSGSPPPDEAVAVYQAAIGQWQDQVAFKATFRLRSGYAKSFEQALKAEFDPSIRPGDRSHVFRASGRLVKQSRWLRFAMDYERPAAEVPGLGLGRKPAGEDKPAGSGYRVNVSFDEVGDGQMTIRYNPKQGSFGDNAGVRLASPKLAGRLAAGPQSLDILSPLNPLPSDNGAPLSLWPLNKPPSAFPTSTEVRQPDADHVEIVLRQKGDLSQERVVRLWAGASPPVLENIRHTITAPKGVRYVYDTTLSDFVDCPGGKVPRRVIYAESADGLFLLQEWVSADLGTEPPGDADFRIVVPPTTVVGGLGNMPVRGTERKLDIKAIKRSDLSDTPMSPGETRSRQGRTYLVAFIAFNVGLVVLMIAYRALKGGTRAGPA